MKSTSSDNPANNYQAFDDLPNIAADCLKKPDNADFSTAAASTHPLKILLLYGSLRKRSFSRLVIEECDRLLKVFGCDTRIFDPTDLPQPGGDEDHPKVREFARVDDLV